MKRQVDWLVNGSLTGPIFSRALNLLTQLEIFPARDKDWPVSAVKLVDDLVGESPTGANYPVGTVVISGDGAGDQTVGSPEVNVLVG